MELLLWLEQIELWRLERKGKEAMSQKDKITEHVTYVPNAYTPKHMLDKAVREYELGLLTSLEEDDDSTTQSVLNELKVRSIDNARHGKRR